MGDGKCNPEDIKCSARLLTRMRDFDSALDDPKFAERYPQLVEFKPELAAAIKAEETALNEALGVCELPEPEPAAPAEPAEGETGE